jgi:serine/threonine-protein kinase
MMSYTAGTNFSQASRISPGTRLNGIYEIDRQIGVGGMGEIYKGHAIQTGDAVAIKLMLPELAENEAALALFRKEASALHHLMHEAIVRYYVFTVEPVLQRPYLAMEFVDGRSLSAILQDNGPLPFEAVHALMKRIAAGLQAAHERGIIHRDVSPDNIIVPGGDVSRAKIIDFGIARSTNLNEGTIIGSGFAGKHNWVSPEQIGLFGGNVTAKSDIYSLGLVLVNALTGTAVDMGGSQVQIVEKRRRVPDLGAIDMRFRPLLDRMLQPHPDKRPDSMAAVAAWPLGSSGLLRGWSDPGKAKKGTVIPAYPAEPRRWGRTIGSALALLAGVAVLGAGGYYLSQSDPLTWIATWSSGDKGSSTGPSTTKQPGTGTTKQPGITTADRTGSSADEIRRYLQAYGGGQCFFITPVAIGEGRATVEGFGASLQPFYKLDEAIKRDLKFEADIAIRLVTDAQCPVITFLAGLRSDRARAPRVDIDSVIVKDGRALTGMVDRFGNLNVDLLLVSDAGTVQNVTTLMRPGTDGKPFSIGMSKSSAGPESQPQLLIAIASVRPLTSLQLPGAVGADQVFPAALAEAQRSAQQVSATARYFRLER